MKFTEGTEPDFLLDELREQERTATVEHLRLKTKDLDFDSENDEVALSRAPHRKCRARAVRSGAPRRQALH